MALKWIEDGVVDPARGADEADRRACSPAAAPDDLPGWFKKAAEAYAEKQLERDELGSKDAATREGLSAVPERRRRARPPAAGGDATTPSELERACAAIDAIVRAEQYLDANVNVSLDVPATRRRPWPRVARGR